MKSGKLLLVMIFFTGSYFLSSLTAYAKEESGKIGIPVLLYHHILKKSENIFKDNPAVINLEAFEEQMKYLKENGFHTATVAELESYLEGNADLPENTVVITFDDGLKTNYLYAYPILKKYGFKATAFLITSRLANTPVPFSPDKYQYLSWPEINEMRDVFQFSSHTDNLHSHVNGEPALLSVSPSFILKDLETSKKLLNTDSLAYPFGSRNQTAISLVKTAGFKYAFTTDAKNAKIGDNPYEIGRIGIYPTTTIWKFKKIISTVRSKRGWINSEGSWRYYDDVGNSEKGWGRIKGNWYYFSKTGKMETGMVKLNSHLYYLSNTGQMRTGWVMDKTSLYHFNDSGEMEVGWRNIGQRWHYFDHLGKKVLYSQQILVY